jgi:hypothetical protein
MLDILWLRLTFYSHQVARQLEPKDKAFVKELINARANAKNIANVLTERNGVNYSSQDVRNIVARIKTNEEVVSTVEEALGEIKDKGVDVRYKKQSNTDNVEVLWVQTKDMKLQLSRSAPRVFECDTTFGYYHWTTNQKEERKTPWFKKRLKENNTESEDLRKRAEYSAGVENTLPFFDSGDICCICDFALNDPVKKLKKVIICPRCSEYVHEPRLVKSGCKCTFWDNKLIRKDHACLFC